MCADEQQLYQDSLHRVNLCHNDSATSAALTGVYVTPMPSQLHTNFSSSISQGTIAEQSGSHKIQEQRANRMHGSNGNAVGQGLELHGGRTGDDEQADASWQGSGTAQATAAQPCKQKKRGHNKTRRRRFHRRSVIAGTEPWI